MATCYQEITSDIANNSINTYPILTPNSIANISYSNTTKQKFLISLQKQESVVFTISISPSVNTRIQIYKYQNQSISFVGNVNSSDNVINFQKDLEKGNYIICISSLFGGTKGTIKIFFSNYVIKPIFHNPTIYDGQVLVVDSIFQKECKEPMKFELIDGNLPPGLTFREDGSITGTLPNLDCIEEDLSPSIHWYYSDENGNYFPFPKRWKFRARVRLVNFPEKFDEEDFFIEVLNDWSLDRDSFLNNIKNGVDFNDLIEVKENERKNKEENQFQTIKNINNNEIISEEILINNNEEDVDEAFLRIGYELNSEKLPFNFLTFSSETLIVEDIKTR